MARKLGRDVKTEDAAALVRDVIIPSLKQSGLFYQIFPNGLGDEEETLTWATKCLENDVTLGQSEHSRVRFEGRDAAFIRCELHHLSDSREEARGVIERMRRMRGGLPFFEDATGLPGDLDPENFQEWELFVKHTRHEVLGGEQDVFCLQQLFVRPDRVRTGLAERLVRWMVWVADEEGWGCYVMVPVFLEGLFKRLGFYARKKQVMWRQSEFVCLTRPRKQVVC